jgi:ribosomal protein S18 acetylase RimI-like enzyme
MNIELKRAGPGDLSLLSEWRMRVLNEVFPDTDPDNIPAIRLNNEDYYKKHLSDGSHTACFALDAESGRILGCGGICYQEEMPSPDNLTGQNGYIMNIYTLPEARGEGIGRQIVEYLIADAKARGTEKIYLESSEIAKNLYHSMGFIDMRDYMLLPQGSE